MAMEFADLSVEIGHLYISELELPAGATGLTDPARELISRRIDAGYAAVVSTIQKYQGRKKPKRVSTAVLIDDYFMPDNLRIDREEIADCVKKSCEDSHIPLDYIVYESALADSVEMLHGRLMPFPKPCSGSEGLDTGGETRWLSNGQLGRDPGGSPRTRIQGLVITPSTEDEDTTRLKSFGARSGQHSLHLDIELYRGENDSRKWACPILAAWWQLVRLGMFRDSDGNSCLPTDTDIVRDGCDAFFAKRTLTALSPEFLGIEAAVRTILEQVSVPPRWIKSLQDDKDEPEADEHLSRIAYTFVADRFHPDGLRESDKWS